MIVHQADRLASRPWRAHVGAVIGWSVLGGLALAGCGSSTPTSPSSPATPSSATGSLSVAVTAPSGVTPSVTVTGPGGYHHSLSATQTLSGLAVGSYTVTATPVTAANPVVATVDTAAVTGGTATVQAGATATAGVSYAARPGSGQLWIANNGAPTIVAYTAAQLGASTGAAPTTALAFAPGTEPVGAAFDASGNLWVTTTSVVEFTASQLGASGSPTPAVTLSATGGSLSGPLGLAFDASGNLWVANYTGNTVVAFAANQLAANGSPTPTVTVSATGGSLNAPVGLAFDASGNLWVTNSGANTVVEFAPSQLGTSGSPTPAVTLSSTVGSLSSPLGLAFDASGNLWVVNGGNTVLQFAASQLTASGSPTPAVTLSAAAGSLDSPRSLAFDASGNLWVTNGASMANTVVEFAAGQLAVSGAPTPTTTVSGSSLGGPYGLAFDPSPANLGVR